MWYNKLIIDHRWNIDQNLIKQAQINSPWDWFRLDFDNPDTDNKYMHFLKSQLIGILATDENKLLSFAWFGQDDRFNSYAAYITWKSSIESCFFMYFFVPEELRGRWYWKTLYEWIINYLQSKGIYKFMNYSTANISNIPAYINRWAKQLWEDRFWNEKQYYFTHELT